MMVWCIYHGRTPIRDMVSQDVVAVHDWMDHGMVPHCGECNLFVQNEHVSCVVMLIRLTHMSI